MDFNSITEFLSGQKLDVGLRIKISRPGKTILYRMDYLVKLAKGKRIIHAGCVDHLPSLEEKIKQNLWLHKLLDEVSVKCVGFDIDDAGIRRVKSLGFTDVFRFDIIREPLPEIFRETHFDLMILGEILEHVDNPVAFLQEIHDKFHKVADQIVITSPNAFFINNLLGIFEHEECINSDHRYWFSPYTLAKISTLAGFKVNSFDFVYNFKTSRNALLKAILFRWFPASRSTIVMVLDF